MSSFSCFVTLFGVPFSRPPVFGAPDPAIATSLYFGASAVRGQQAARRAELALLVGNHNANRLHIPSASPTRPAGHSQLVGLRSKRYAQLGLGAPRLCHSGHAGDLSPGLKGLGAGGSVLIGGD